VSALNAVAALLCIGIGVIVGWTARGLLESAIKSVAIQALTIAVTPRAVAKAIDEMTKKGPKHDGY
jgi:formate hydrogenlyase subunit 3/multisubunit Na+/H+ antiporter MnhD subunit